MKEQKEKIRAEFINAYDLYEMAINLINSQESIRHIDVNEVIFLKEMETRPRALAKTYALTNHPIQFFTNARFLIVFYESNIDYFTQEQRAILLLHELMHIPALGEKLVDHDIKDFYEILKLGVDWCFQGAKVPKLIEDGEGETKEEKKTTKDNGI